MSQRRARAARAGLPPKPAKVGTPLADRAVSRKRSLDGGRELSEPSTRGLRALIRRRAITGES